MTAETLVRAVGITRDYRDATNWFGRRDPVRAVRDVSLDIDRGEALALVGESGSGKTTLGRCLLRLIEPTAGRVFIDGIDIGTLRAGALRRFRRRMQIVFQDPAGSLNPRMTVGTAVREPMEIQGLASGDAARRRVRDLFAEVGLDPTLMGRYPHELSGGQKQRVGIARALSVRPEFLVLDEPVSALDVSVQAQVLNLLQDLRTAHDLTYLFIAHDLAVVRHIADRIAVMYLGRIVESGPAAAVYQHPRHPYTTALLSAVPVPDPRAARERIVLRGDIPSPRTPPPGCPFETRCFHPARDARCCNEMPPLVTVGEHHLVACHYHDQSSTPSGGTAQAQAE